MPLFCISNFNIVATLNKLLYNIDQTLFFSLENKVENK